MNYEIFIVLGVIVFIIISLYRNWMGIALTFFIANIVLGVTGILTPKEILSGFSNQNVIVIVMLLLLGEIIRQMHLVDTLFARIFKYAKNYKWFLIQMMFFVSFFSTFMNNTPLVAIMLPFVINWSKKHNVDSSLLLMPLSFSAIIGGTATLIGSSTNLMVNGLVMDQNIIPDLPSLGMFDFTPVGGIMIIIGILYFYLFGKGLLKPVERKKRRRKRKAKIAQIKEYYLEVVVRENSPLAGKKIKETILGEKRNVRIVEIIRNGELIKDVSKEMILKGGDVLHLTGKKEEVAEFIDKAKDVFNFPLVGMFFHKKKMTVTEIVISHNSSFINKKLGEIKFSSRFDSTPIAIHRNGESFYGEKIKDIPIKAGDLILLIAGDDFYKLAESTNDFYPLSEVLKMEKYPLYKSLLVLLGFLSAIVVASVGLTSLFISLSVLFVFLIAFKVVSPKDIHYKIDYNLLAIIALSLSLGTAMIKTGTAEYLAYIIDKLFVPAGPIVIMLTIYLITSLLAAYITNKAAVALVFPIVLTLALHHGFDPKPFVLLVSYAAAANFMTPIGYQTNLMVYGPGNYTFKDFFRVGFPLTIIYMLVSVFVLYGIYF
jgi:di/tricarboxylate transporter